MIAPVWRSAAAIEPRRRGKDLRPYEVSVVYGAGIAAVADERTMTRRKYLNSDERPIHKLSTEADSPA